MAGRPPKPVSQRLAEGNPGKRPIPTVVVMGGVGVPDKPAGLSGLAGAIWDREVPKMVDAGLLDLVDGPMLGQYFQAWAIAVTAVKGMTDSEGEVDPFLHEPNDFTGELKTKKHPGMTVWKDAVATMRQIATEFGLTPAARARLGLLNSAAGRVEDIEGDIGIAKRFLNPGSDG